VEEYRVRRVWVRTTLATLLGVVTSVLAAEALLNFWVGTAFDNRIWIWQDPGTGRHVAVEGQSRALGCGRLASGFVPDAELSSWHTERPHISSNPPRWLTSALPVRPATIAIPDTPFTLRPYSLVYCGGWPARCVWKREDIPFAADSVSSSVRRIDIDGITLATGILWPGLLANTAFYGAIWFGLLLIPGAIRRTHRRRRGQCPGCGYQLAGVPPERLCPECGRARVAAVRSRTVVAQA
jgi:hypothetical protein